MRIWWLVFAVVMALALSGCSKPEPPTIEPEAAKVTSVATTGLELEITLNATNPNKIPLVARKVTARVKLNNDIDLGEVVVDTKVEIPAKGSAKIVAPLSMKWGDVGQVATLAWKQENIPFTVEGTAQIGFETVNFDVPFKTQGTLTREQIKDLGLKTLPQLPTSLPGGLQLPTSLPF